MTIAAAYLTSEGVVLGADSTSTVIANGEAAQLLNHAQKVFEVGESTPWGLCTFGLGRVGGTSHRSIAALLGDALNPLHDDVPAAAAKLAEIVNERVAPNTVAGELGYFLAGRVPGSREPQCVEVRWSGGHIAPRISRLHVGEARFGGAFNYFVRVFNGFDPALLPQLLGTIKGHYGPNLPPDFDEVFVSSFQQVARNLASTGYQDLPIREAIDYVHTYLTLTIKAFKFRFGPPSCGGPVEVAYITTDRNFRWACHKPAGSAIDETMGYGT